MQQYAGVFFPHAEDFGNFSVTGVVHVVQGQHLALALRQPHEVRGDARAHFVFH
jgi:hypothetical protein